MGHSNLRRSAGLTCLLENAYGPAAHHRVLSYGYGAAEMADELGLGTRARVRGRAAADLISVPWHPIPRLGGRAAHFSRSPVLLLGTY